MSRFFILAIILLLSVNTKAQKIRFTDTSNKWTYIHEEWDSRGPGFKKLKFSIRQYYAGDTLINGKTYLKLASYKALDNTTTYSYVREDGSGKIFYYSSWSPTGESMMMSNSGDWKPNDIIGYLPYSVEMRIASIDSISINNVFHKLALAYARDPRGTWNSDPTYYIEGIGFTKNRRTRIDENVNLRCFFNSTGRPIISNLPDSNKSNCSESALSIPNSSHTASNLIRIHPQPAHDKVTIELPFIVSNGKLTIINSMGQIIYKKTINSLNHVVISNNFPQGIYYYRITDNATNNIYTGRLIFAD